MCLDQIEFSKPWKLLLLARFAFWYCVSPLLFVNRLLQELVTKPFRDILYKWYKLSLSSPMGTEWKRDK